MRHVLVRYSDIGTKSRHVRNRMRQVLRQRVADVFLLYFYNRPIAAEDHLMRFKASLQKLQRFHPA